MDRRRFLIGAGSLGVAIGAGACSGGDSSSGSSPASPTTVPAPRATPGLPEADTMTGWIEEICDFGVRRAGSDAGHRVEQWCADRFRELGLDDVTLEPFAVPMWLPEEWSLTVVDADGAEEEIDCFPLPFTVPADDLDLDLVAFDPAAPGAVDVAGRAALVSFPPLRFPAVGVATVGTVPPDEPIQDRVVDLSGTLSQDQITPGSPVPLDAAHEAGAAALIGVLDGHPGDTPEHYWPYDAEERPPAVWVGESGGDRLRELLADGPVRVRLAVRSRIGEGTSHHVVGTLPGPGDEWVQIGSHHDAPWASAVEDGTGIAMVIAQAAHWASVPAEERPHNLRFILHGGHMAGGLEHTWADAHAADLPSVVLHVHLEHAGLEVTYDAQAAVTDLPVPRWWYTSPNPALRRTVIGAARDQRLDRSMLVEIDMEGDSPPTDARALFRKDVPGVSFCPALSYLIRPFDTIDKVDRDGLVPITRATIAIIESTAGVSADEMRAGIPADRRYRSA